MATYEIIAENGNKVAVRVLFDDKAFVQELIGIPKEGTSRDAKLQAYADDYERQYSAVVANDAYNEKVAKAIAETQVEVLSETVEG